MKTSRTAMNEPDEYNPQHEPATAETLSGFCQCGGVRRLYRVREIQILGFEPRLVFYYSPAGDEPRKSVDVASPALTRG